MLKNVKSKKAVDLVLTCLGAVASPPPGPIIDKARMWSRAGIFVSLLEPGATAFRRLVELIEKEGRIDDKQKAREVFSRDYIESKVQELIGDLIAEAARADQDAAQLTDEQVRPVWREWLEGFDVPSQVARHYTLVAGLVLEEPVEIGTVKLSPLDHGTRSTIFAELGLSEGEDPDRERWEQEIKEDINRDFPLGPGNVVAQAMVEGAEPIRARELFRERVKEALHVLAFFRCFIWPVGARVVVDLSGSSPSGGNVFLSGTLDGRVSQAYEHSTLPLTLTKRRWEHARMIGLSFVSEMLSKPRADRSPFEASCITAIEWVSRGLQDDVADSRFLKFCIGMESLLLQECDQPLGGTMGDRVAFLLGGTGDARERISSELKAIYSIRSDIAHEGRSELLEEELGPAQFYAVHVVRVFLDRMRVLKWQEWADFSQWCTRQKWHGGTS
jgi:hypothetical protein